MTSSRATTAWLATVLAAVAVGVSHGQSPDQQIETQVTQALREEAVLRSVTVSVQEQVVTLGGPVPACGRRRPRSTRHVGSSRYGSS